MGVRVEIFGKVLTWFSTCNKEAVCTWLFSDLFSLPAGGGRVYVCGVPFSTVPPSRHCCGHAKQLLQFWSAVVVS